MQRHVSIFGASTDPNSRSQILAAEAHRQLVGRGVSADLIDLRLERWRDATDTLRAETARSTHLLIAVPIYNLSVGSPAKRLIEQFSADDLAGKTAGILCAAGGERSYMAAMPFANSLMLDFRLWIVPRFVYATGGDFADGAIANPEIIKRIAGLTREMFEHDLGQ